MSRVVQQWLPWGIVVLLLVLLGSGIGRAQTASGVINACKENRTGVLSAVPNRVIATTTCPASDQVVTTILGSVRRRTAWDAFISRL